MTHTTSNDAYDIKICHHQFGPFWCLKKRMDLSNPVDQNMAKQLFSDFSFVNFKNPLYCLKMKNCKIKSFFRKKCV